MAETIAIFPLSLVVFPGEKLNLHIFEPRYRELINDALSSQIPFGIPSYINGKLCDIGTLVELESVERVYAKGEMDVSTKGQRVFTIKEIVEKLPNKLYAGAEIEWLDDTFDSDESTKTSVLNLLKDLHQTLKINKADLDNPDTFNTYKVAHLVGFNLEEEYKLLSMRNESEREQMMLTHLQKIIPIVKETENLKSRVQANGHFKNIIPPEI